MHSRDNNQSDLCVGEEGRGQLLSCACLVFVMSTRQAASPVLTVGLVSGGRVRCRSPVDDGVGSEVGELRDGSQQTTGIFLGKAKRYLLNV